jgi:hypothetical protein
MHSYDRVLGRELLSPHHSCFGILQLLGHAVVIGMDRSQALQALSKSWRETFKSLHAGAYQSVTSGRRRCLQHADESRAWGLLLWTLVGVPLDWTPAFPRASNSKVVFVVVNDLLL